MVLFEVLLLLVFEEIGLLFNVVFFLILIVGIVVFVMCFDGKDLGFMMGFLGGLVGIEIKGFLFVCFLLLRKFGKKIIVRVIIIIVFISLFFNVDVIVFFCLNIWFYFIMCVLVLFSKYVCYGNKRIKNENKFISLIICKCVLIC